MGPWAPERDCNSTAQSREEAQFKELVIATTFKANQKGPCALCGEMVWSTEQRCKTPDGLQIPRAFFAISSCMFLLDDALEDAIQA